MDNTNKVNGKNVFLSIFGYFRTCMPYRTSQHEGGAGPTASARSAGMVAIGWQTWQCHGCPPSGTPLRLPPGGESGGSGRTCILRVLPPPPNDDGAQ
jgi:hypothetical protein